MRIYTLIFILLIFCMPVYTLDMVIQDGHSSEVNAVQVDPNGQYLISCSNDALVKVWSLITEKLLFTLPGHKDAVNSVAIDNKGIYAFSASKDKSIKIWDLKTGKLEKTIDCPAVVFQVVFDPAGKQIISSHMDDKIRIWNKDSGTLIRSITVEYEKDTPLQAVRSFALDPVGSRFIACTGETDKDTSNKAPGILILDFNTGKQLKELKSHTGKINALFIDKSGSSLFSAGADKTIKVWDCKQWQLVKSLSGFKSGITALASDPAGEWVAAAEENGTLSVVDFKTGMIVASIKSRNSRINALTVSPDGRYILSGEADKTIKIRDKITGRPHSILEGNVDSFSAIVLFPGNKQAATGMDTGEIKIWDLATGALKQVLNGHKGAVKSLIIDNKKNLLLSAGSDTAIKIWDLTSFALLNTLSGHTKDVNSLSIDRNGKLLASGSDDETIKIWDLQSGKLLKTINNFMWVFGPVEQPGFIADQKGAAMPEAPGRTREKSLEVKASVRGRYWINAVLFDPGSDDLISAGYDGVKIWNIETGRVKNTLFSGFNPVNTVAIDSARKYTVSGDVKGQIVIWKFSNPTVVKKIPGAHTGAVNKIAVTPDNQHFISASDDNLINVWRISDGEPVAALPGHQAPVLDLALPDEGGDYFFSTGSDRSMKFWRQKEQDTLSWVTRGNEWFNYTNEGYFNCTSRGIALMGIARAPGVYGMELVSVKYNRPDLLLDKLYIKNQPYISYYTALYKEKLSRIAFSEDQLLPGIALPVVTIDKTARDGKFLVLDFKLTESESKLKTYNIALNGHALYAMPGKGVEEKLREQEAEKLKAAEKAAAGQAAAEAAAAAAAGKKGAPDNKQKTEPVQPAIAEPDPGTAEIKAEGEENNPEEKAAEEPGKSAYITEQIELAGGFNIVEVSCINEAGIRSAGARYVVEYEAPVDSTLYFIGFGVSQYNDQMLNLNFARQDVKDTADFLSTLTSFYNRCLIKIFTDKEVEKDAIAKAGDFIATAKLEAVKLESARAADLRAKKEADQAAKAEATAASKKVGKAAQKKTYDDTYKKVFNSLFKTTYNKAYQQIFEAAVKEPSANDTLILYLNGHIYRDDNPVPGSYFYPFSVNQSDKEHTAIGLASLTSLLDRPKPFNKLLLLDVSGSPELQTGIAEKALKLPADLKPRFVPSADQDKITGNRELRTFLNNSDLYFFNNPLLNTGVIELASCQWGELSLESSKLKNGLFTDNLLNVLSRKATDQDEDGQLSMSELYTALYADMVKDSNDLQHPLLQGAEINPDFRLPAGKK